MTFHLYYDECGGVKDPLCAERYINLEQDGGGSGDNKSESNVDVVHGIPLACRPPLTPAFPLAWVGLWRRCSQRRTRYKAGQQDYTWKFS